jgi:hypothetical protein
MLRYSVLGATGKGVEVLMELSTAEQGMDKVKEVEREFVEYQKQREIRHHENMLRMLRGEPLLPCIR